MPVFLKCLASLPCGNLLPEDAVENTFHFQSDVSETPVSAATAASAYVKAFYLAVDQYIAAQYGPTLTLKWYDMEDPEPRPPIYTTTQALTMGSGQSLPSEVALCMSYQAVRLAGFDQARRRGRIYIGPIDTDYNTTVNFVTRPTTDMIGAIKDAGQSMMTNSTAALRAWSVFSPTTYASTSSLLNSFHPITNGWVDNSFDTQRRRGSKPTTRTVWP